MMHIVLDQREIGLFLRNAIMGYGKVDFPYGIGLLAAEGDVCTGGAME